MSSRERWIVYPLLLLALGAILPDKIISRITCNQLIVNGRGVNLVKCRFSCAERRWEMSGGQIGRALWGMGGPGSAEAEELARRLWPEEAERRGE